MYKYVLITIKKETGYLETGVKTSKKICEQEFALIPVSCRSVFG